jgi:GNAT superfamily N-acetyltransferase
MKIRSMAASDLGAVTGLCAQLVEGERSAGEMAERFAKIAGDSRHLMVVAVDGEDRAVAWMHLHETFLFVAEPCLQVFALVVDESCRGRGVGRLLMAFAEREASERGLKRVYLHSQIARAEAHAFYERLGYAKLKTQHAFEKRPA